MKAKTLVVLVLILILSSAQAGQGADAWTPYAGNPVLIPSPTGWDNLQVQDPCVIKDGGQYRMYYTGLHSDGVAVNIGLATSRDGVTWTKYTGNPIVRQSLAWEGSGVKTPAVLKVGDVYHMWYVSGSGDAVGYAVSLDGIRWTKHPDPVMRPSAATWEQPYINGLRVISDTRGFLMYYGSGQIGVATSDDGLGWSKYPGNPIIRHNMADWDTTIYKEYPTILHHDRTYHMWYSNGTFIGLATSGDGFSWTKQGPITVLGNGSTMPSVLEDGGVLHMWYSRLGYSIYYATTSSTPMPTPTPSGTPHTPTATATRTRTATATPTVGPGTPVPVGPWNLYQGNPVLPGGGDGWDYYAAAPAVLKEGSQYWMYYRGGGGPGYVGGAYIGLATSSDGITWSRRPAPVLSPDPEGWASYEVTDPMVLKHNGVYHMWFRGGLYIGHATSSDGITWNKHPVPVLVTTAGSWDAQAVERPWVILDGHGFRMYYAGADGSAWSIGMATSPDGVNWTKYAGNPLIRYANNPWGAYPASHPCVVVVGNTYHMWFQGSYAIHHATSPDGIVWSPAAVTPALTGNVGWPSVLFEQTAWRLWTGAPYGIIYAATDWPPTPTPTPTHTHTPTVTPSSTATPTATPRVSVFLPVIFKSVPRPTNTPTATQTSTPTPTPTPGWAVIMHESFEGDFPGPWLVFDANGASYGEFYWAKSSCDKFSGAFSAWAVGGGASGSAMQCGWSYPSFTDSWMVYGPISLAAAHRAELRFKTRINSETGYDGLCYGVSTDERRFYGTCISGQMGWGERALDLNNVPTLGNVAGQPSVWLAFVFTSDSMGERPDGAFVDDVRVHICSATYPGGCPGFWSPSDWSEPPSLRLRDVELLLPE